MSVPYKCGDIITFRHDFISAYDLYLWVVHTTDDEAYGFVGYDDMNALLDYVDKSTINNDENLVVYCLTDPLMNGSKDINFLISDAEYAFRQVSKLYKILEIHNTDHEGIISLHENIEETNKDKASFDLRQLAVHIVCNRTYGSVGRGKCDYEYIAWDC